MPKTVTYRKKDNIRIRQKDLADPRLTKTRTMGDRPKKKKSVYRRGGVNGSVNSLGMAHTDSNSDGSLDRITKTRRPQALANDSNNMIVNRNYRGEPFLTGSPASVQALRSAGAPATWTPSLVTTLLWLDASDTSDTNIVQVGGLVSQWSDKSGNDYHVAQTDATEQPTTGATTVNSLNVIDFTDPGALTAGKFLEKDSAPYPEYDFRDTYIVAKWTGVANPSYAMLFGGKDSGNDQIGYMATGTGIYQGWQVSAGSGTLYYNTSSSSPSPDAITILRNETMLQIAAAGDPDAKGINVGHQSTYISSRTWVGHIAEIVSFSTLRDADEKEIMEGYLMHKWGMEGNLPVDHTYKDSAPLA